MSKPLAVQAPDRASRLAAAGKPRTAGRPTHDDALQLRERLLDAAKSVFMREGFGAARVEEIASLAGVSKTTVYRQFGTKEELFRAIVWRGMADLRGKIAQHLEPGRDFSTNLASLIDALVEHMAIPDSMHTSRMVIGEAIRFPDVARQFLQFVVTMLEPLTGVLEAAAANGMIDIDDPATAARDLLTLVTGAPEVHLAIQTTRVERKRRAERIHRILLTAWKYRATLDKARVRSMP
ncbi:TetR/AcrR family transcriptional regulator [Paraburkholderia diazotrophica]|uniref:Transcriptional regulator, TetR family n=1 Tax=Paraburkholderia diazotrophica TaxID=667676 RepID=A0A1H7E9I0_9BURK|nr:TetR/AcrR family transcriptional regulator [Paraburkholderia diazotrophica]SEK08732.1 transcriptional regulator, TetR family [Paraburkholderia diazotrophica]